MEKPDVSIHTGSACKAMRLKETILKRFTQQEYLEEHDLEPGTLELILEEVKKMDYIIGNNWKTVFDKYLDKYNINIIHFIEFEDFTHTVFKYRDGTERETFSSTGMRK